MDDNALVCGYCGTAFGGSSAEKFNPEDPQKKEKTKKIIKTVAIVVIAAIVLSVVGNFVSSFVGYRGAVRKFMDAYKSDNPDAIFDMTCSFMHDSDYEDLTELIIYRYDSMLENDFDIFDEYFGSKYSIKYEITDASKLSEHQANSMMEGLISEGLVSEDYADFFKKIMIARVCITAKHGSDSTSINKDIYLAKESNGWKLISFE